MKLWIALALALVCGNLQAATYTYTATIDESQEVPPTGAIGLGVGIFTLDDVSGLFTWDVNYLDLTGEALAAHIHTAAPGNNGGVIIDLDSAGTVISSGVGNGQTFGQFEGSVVLAPALIPLDLFAPNLYINIHTVAHPGGEIRGDLAFAAVPLPPAALLLGGGLGVLARIRRR